MNRYTDPKTAPVVPVQTEMTWRQGMAANERTMRLVGWVRKTDRLVVYEGRVVLAEVSEEPVGGDDAEWLRNIGARP